MSVLEVCPWPLPFMGSGNVTVWFELVTQEFHAPDQNAKLPVRLYFLNIT